MTTMIRVKYRGKLDCYQYKPTVKKTVGSSRSNVEAAPMEKEELVNIDCPIGLVLKYIREFAQLDTTCEFDLCDERNGQLRHVFSVDPCTSGLEVLQPDLTYLIVIYERDSNGQVTCITTMTIDKTFKKCEVFPKKSKSCKKNASAKSQRTSRNSGRHDPRGELVAGTSRGNLQAM